MKTLGEAPYFKVINWDDLMAAASEWLGLPYNSGSWNCPKEGGFNAVEKMKEYFSHYYQGESKFCIIVDIDPPEKTDILDPKEFIEKENLGAYDGSAPNFRDKTHRQREFKLYPLIRSLARAGYLEIGGSYMIMCEY